MVDSFSVFMLFLLIIDFISNPAAFRDSGLSTDLMLFLSGYLFLDKEQRSPVQMLALNVILHQVKWTHLFLEVLGWN